MVTGSVATILYGEPRLTNDIDIVVEITSHRIQGFAQAFAGEDFYLKIKAIRSAVRRRGQFNLIHPASGLKVDFMVSPGTPFDTSRFSRARRLPAGETFTASFASPEDVILEKLEYFQSGGSDKHLRDIGGMLRISGDHLDHAYLEEWAQRLGLLEEWMVARSRADDQP